jgi:uncharacterized GH25 family protein
MTVLKTILAGLACCAATAAAAHDFWLQPVRWRVEQRAPTSLTLQVGHGPYRQRSPIPASRIVRFESVGPDGRRGDLRSRLHPGGADDATIALAGPGTHLLVLETDNRAESHLPAIRFNDYLRIEGLTPAIALRTRTGRMGEDGSEKYSRHAKAILQVGPVDPRGQAQVSKPLGLALEIVPERSPIGARGGALPVRVLYHGRALGGALVKLTDLAHDAEPVAMQRTDANGRAVFAMPGRGSWLLNVIWTRPQPRSSLTDFETDFSSLSFGIFE